MSQKKNRHYPEEFKREALQLLAAGGRSASDIERELDITQGLLSRWQRKAERRGEFQPEEQATTIGLEEQVKQLKRENARLREEKAVLKKAISIFSHRPG
jgi:transposase